VLMIHYMRIAKCALNIEKMQTLPSYHRPIGLNYFLLLLVYSFLYYNHFRTGLWSGQRGVLRDPQQPRRALC